MYQENNKHNRITLLFSGSAMRTFVVTVFSFSLIAIPVVFSATEDAQAGELFRGNQTLRRQSGLGNRRIVKSTKAQRYLNSARSSKTLDFGQSSPYEARMVSYDAAVRKYEKDYAKWENKTDQMQAKQDQKLEKQKQKDSIKKKREQEKLARLTSKEQERASRKNRQSNKSSSPTSFLTRAFGGKETPKEENKTVIVDEKAKKAEAFFGSVETEAIPTETESPAKPKLSFWQRLSRALFGGK